MDEQASQHTFKSSFYLFDLCLVIIMADMLRCIVFHPRRKLGLYFALFGWCCPHVFVVPWSRTSSGRLWRSREGKDWRDQAETRGTWCYQRYLSISSLIFNHYQRRSHRRLGSCFHVSFEALFCCGGISCSCLTSTWDESLASSFWRVRKTHGCLFCITMGVKLQLLFLAEHLNRHLNKDI